MTAHDGDLDLAFQELNKLQLRPFLMRIWGQADPASGEVASGAAPQDGAAAAAENGKEKQ